MPDPKPPSETPEELAGPRYALGEQFSKGGMGGLWYARESATGRTIALKRILGRPDAESFRRFLNEARITARLEHPNIVPVHGLGTDPDGHPFYTMKLVQGTDLAGVLKKLAKGDPDTIARYPLAQLLIIFQKVCDAVAFAHSHHVIHRDLKPANIMLGPFGEVLVMDWGLAKDLGKPKSESACERPLQSNDSANQAPDAEYTPAAKPARPEDEPVTVVRPAPLSQDDRETAEGEPNPSPDEVGATLPGQAFGSPHYMAPEQARGDIDLHDARTDIYSLGAVLYEILALRRPVSGTKHAILSRVIDGDLDPLLLPLLSATESDDADLPPELRRPKLPRFELRHLPGGVIPASLIPVVLRAMAFKPERRYQSVLELQSEVTAFQDGFAPSVEQAGLGRQIMLALRRNRREATVAAAALVLLLAVVAASFVRIRSERDLADNQRIRAENGEKQAVENREEAQRQKEVAEKNLLAAQAARTAQQRQIQIAADADCASAEKYLGESGQRAPGHRLLWGEALAHYGRALSFVPDSSRAQRGVIDVLQRGPSARMRLPTHWLPRPAYAAPFYASLMAVAPNGSRVLLQTAKDEQRVFEPTTGRWIGKPLLGEASSSGAAFSSDSRWMVLPHAETHVNVVDLETGTSTQLSAPPLKWVIATIWPDATFAAALDERGNLVRWSLPSGELVRDRSWPTGFATAVLPEFVWSPDGRYLVIHSREAATVWEANTGRQLLVAPKLKEEVIAAVFSPDSSRFAVVWREGSVQGFSLPSGKPLAPRIQCHISWRGAYWNSKNNTLEAWGDPRDFDESEGGTSLFDLTRILDTSLGDRNMPEQVDFFEERLLFYKIHQSGRWALGDLDDTSHSFYALRTDERAPYLRLYLNNSEKPKGIKLFSGGVMALMDDRLCIWDLDREGSGALGGDHESLPPKPIGPWMFMLAEAASGLAFDADGALQQVPMSRRLELCEKLHAAVAHPAGGAAIDPEWEAVLRAWLSYHTPLKITE